MAALDLADLASGSLQEALLGCGVPGDMVHELVEAVMRVNYGQVKDVSYFPITLTLM